jgi:hypothetical protein
LKRLVSFVLVKSKTLASRLAFLFLDNDIEFKRFVSIGLTMFITFFTSNKSIWLGLSLIKILTKILTSNIKCY